MSDALSPSVQRDVEVLLNVKRSHNQSRIGFQLVLPCIAYKAGENNIPMYRHYVFRTGMYSINNSGDVKRRVAEAISNIYGQIDQMEVGAFTNINAVVGITIILIAAPWVWLESTVYKTPRCCVNEPASFEGGRRRIPRNAIPIHSAGLYPCWGCTTRIMQPWPAGHQTKQ